MLNSPMHPMSLPRPWICGLSPLTPEPVVLSPLWSVLSAVRQRGRCLGEREQHVVIKSLTEGGSHEEEHPAQ